jgi:phosphoenolpyruvate carboxylase
LGQGSVPFRGSERPKQNWKLEREIRLIALSRTLLFKKSFS